MYGQEATVLEAGFGKEARNSPCFAGTQLPITIPELLALILWERNKIKARLLWIKTLTNRANYSSVIWIFTQWTEFSWKPFSWVGSFDDVAAVYILDPILLIPARDSSVGCLLPTQTPHGFSPSFLEAKASAVEAELINMLGARFPSSGKSLTNMPECHDGILVFTVFQIFKYLGNFHSLILLQGEPFLLVCLSYQIQSTIINFNHSLDVPCWRVSDVD